MRKTTEHVIAAAVTLVTLAGCGSDDIGPDAGVGKDSPDFTATIGGASTRAFDSSWEAGRNRYQRRHPHKRVLSYKRRRRPIHRENAR